ncbi:MAG TPA: galactose-1-epimerase [Cytophagales bacterium]|jgi:aldose 1-epimerase|nr:galactose-1-epimerase [Cytophagales bacterium]
MKNNISLFILALIFLSVCTANKNDKGNTIDQMNKVTDFGKMPDGRQVKRYTISNKNGLMAGVINYGGIITNLIVPDKNGEFEDVVLGYNNLDDYLKFNPYFGAIIGRYGNRIAKGKFPLNDTTYSLVQNNIGNHLHGGDKGFDKVFWDIEPFENEEGEGLVLTYTSENMEEGYPGKLEVTVTYMLGHDNSLTCDYKAKTDKTTIVNLTQHSYFNLTAMEDDILDHQLTINADRFLPVDNTLIPTGELRPVKGTPFDFSQSKVIGVDIGIDNNQLEIANGFDHCWALNDGEDKMAFAARLYEPKSGRLLEVFTTEPGIQFYSGNFLDGEAKGKNGVRYKFRSGLCLETQHFPDSPNQPDFPSVVLEPGASYHSTTKFIFSVK